MAPWRRDRPASSGCHPGRRHGPFLTQARCRGGPGSRLVTLTGRRRNAEVTLPPGTCVDEPAAISAPSVARGRAAPWVGRAAAGWPDGGNVQRLSRVGLPLDRRGGGPEDPGGERPVQQDSGGLQRGAGPGRGTCPAAGPGGRTDARGAFSCPSPTRQRGKKKKTLADASGLDRTVVTRLGVRQGPGTVPPRYSCGAARPATNPATTSYSFQ
jgi:hypothetical protein